ncbi:FAR1-RELATED SEQUENCE 5 [Spatholobus suberectus]|nr:FAR1-RELATED SEQUENCE 5 [Spatholobus suberectus]
MNELFINFIDCCVELEYHLCNENNIPDSFVAAVEFGIDGSITVETVGNTAIGEISSTADDNREGGSSVEPTYKQDQDDNVTQDSSGGITIPSAIPTVSVVSVEEPYVGQEFESESAAHAFYNAYATNVGFVIRVSKLSRSRRDGSAIGRALVCNKEGFRMPDRREKVVRQRAETRVGCRAMILVRKVSSGKWFVSKFVKEHTHPLAPGKGRRDFIYEQYPNEQDKIRELSQQLAIEKKRSATYKRHLELIFEHIEEHNEGLSKKIQHIVASVKEMETKEQQSQL